MKLRALAQVTRMYWPQSSTAMNSLKLSTRCIHDVTTSSMTKRTEQDSTKSTGVKDEKVVRKETCGDLNYDDEDDMEQEDMFVDAHETFKHKKMEWGGPRRGGRLPEPTRYGDWERKGRCSDF